MRLWRAITRNHARTHPQARDPRLRGRVYELPYRQVWQAVQDEAAAMPRWTVDSVDARAGVLGAEARTRMWKFVDDVEVRVSLDLHGWTRVDVRSASRAGGADLGANARRIARFLHRLDARLSPPGRGAQPDQPLDP
jgi:uncharacterized protein (DUF1499 family)